MGKKPKYRHALMPTYIGIRAMGEREWRKRMGAALMNAHSRRFCRPDKPLPLLFRGRKE
jgi:hypothetical protein